MADKCTYFRRGHVSESQFLTLNVVREHNEVRALVQTFLRLGQFTNLSIDGEGGGMGGGVMIPLLKHTAALLETVPEP